MNIINSPAVFSADFTAGVKFKPYYKRFKDKPAECYFCGSGCYGILGFKNGSEVFSCVGCALTHCDRKLKKKLKKLKFSCVKNRKVGISERGLR